MTSLGQSCTTGINAFLVGNVSVEGFDIESANKCGARNLVLDHFEFPEKVWGVVDVGGNLWNKRLDEVINKEGYILSRGAVARDDGPTRIIRLVDLGK